jgi:NAD(P)-dependent dehydrogenase (short-subunit alcohol dehydrogenase family)
VGRSVERGARMLAALRETGPGAEHAFVLADLSLMGETARVADRVAALSPRLDAAVLCAGILSATPEWTEEGLERNFALNYLTRYLLARRILPALAAAPSGRLVLVANAGVYRDTLDMDDLQHRRGRPGLAVAGRTQFANDLLAVELADRMRDTGVEVTCVFPGMVRTSVMRNARGLPWFARTAGAALHWLLARSPAAAADTPVFLARDAQATGTGGRFYGPRRIERAVPEGALRLDRRRALWAASEELVRRHLPGEAAERGRAA